MGVNGIYGLSGSGLDIESMVKVGMLSKQNQYDKMQQTYTKNEWQKQAYNDIYSTLQTFNNSTLSQYKMQSSMNAKLATSSSDSVTATARGDAPILNHKIQVQALSSAAYLVSTNKLTRYDSSSNSGNPDSDQSSIKLSDTLFQGLQRNTSGGTTRVNVHAVGDTSTDTNLHRTTDIGFELKVSDGTKTASGDLKYSTISYTYGQLLNGKTFNDLASDINALGLNVRASYDSVNDSFSFFNKEGGKDNSINFNVDDSSDAGKTAKYFLQNLHLLQSQNGTLIGADGQEVSDVSNTTNFFGKDSTAPSVSTTNTLNSWIDNTGETVVDENSDIEYVIFQDMSIDDGGNVSYTLFNGDSSADASSANVASDNALSFKINDEEFSYTFDRLRSETVTVQNVIDDINSRAGLNVTATFEDGKLSVKGNATGEDQSISISSLNDVTSKLFNALGFTDDNTDGTSTLSFDESATTDNPASATVAGTGNSNSFPISLSGTNGVAIIDGITYDNITDNKITAAGVTYTLNETTDEAVTVNVKQDTEGVIDKVKSFVEDYNKLLSGLYEKYDEKQYKDYKPLTESQKDKMKDEEIEKWEEKAKSGILYHDQTLSKLIYNMRDAVSEPIEGLNGKYKSVFSLGITTTGTKGQLTLDEDKLRAALNDDPDSVYNVFGRLDPQDSNNFDGNGVAQRLGDVFTAGIKSIRERAGTDDTTNDDSDLGVLMRELQTKMDNFKKLMDDFENKLYKKYDAMEVALSRLGVQLNYITGGQ